MRRFFQASKKFHNLPYRKTYPRIVWACIWYFPVQVSRYLTALFLLIGWGKTESANFLRNSG